MIAGLKAMVIPLHVPREIEALANESGEPVAVMRNGRRIRVAAILNTWRIDDEWWREEISRQYFQVELKGGLVLNIFHDLVSGKWYQQGY